MSYDNYAYRQLHMVMDDHPEQGTPEKYRVKAASVNGESKWVTVSYEQYLAMVNAVRPLYSHQERVSFTWSTAHGRCDECGNPAFYECVELGALCPVCAASTAADGISIHRLNG